MSTTTPSTTSPERQSFWRLIPGRTVMVLAGLVFRYACHGFMTLLTLMAEMHPTPQQFDFVLKWMPYVGWIDRYNYGFWLACYGIGWFLLMKADFKAFLRFLYCGGVLSIIRGLCVISTILGPPKKWQEHLDHPYTWSEVLDNWYKIINPTFLLETNHIERLPLVQDCFFSGHIATTFLLFLFTPKGTWTRKLALLLHIITLVIVYLSHLHLTIDIIGAWAITYCLYALFNRILNALEKRKSIVMS